MQRRSFRSKGQVAINAGADFSQSAAIWRKGQQNVKAPVIGRHTALNVSAFVMM